MASKLLTGLGIGFVLGLAAATSIHDAIADAERSKSKRSAADARAICRALERYRQANGRYPPLDGGMEKLVAQLTPAYARALPSRDVHGQPFLVLSDGVKPVVVSLGRHGIAVSPPPR